MVSQHSGQVMMTLDCVTRILPCSLARCCRQEHPPGDVPPVHDPALCFLPRLRGPLPQAHVHTHEGTNSKGAGARVPQLVAAAPRQQPSP
jgi:hypothetical protein